MSQDLPYPIPAIYREIPDLESQVEQLLLHLDDEFGTGLGPTELGKAASAMAFGLSEPISTTSARMDVASALKKIQRLALQIGWVVHSANLPFHQLTWLPRSQTLLILIASDGSLLVAHQRKWGRFQTWNARTGQKKWQWLFQVRDALGLGSWSQVFQALLLSPALPADGLRGQPSSALHPWSPPIPGGLIPTPKGSGIGGHIPGHGPHDHAHPSPLARLYGLLRPEQSDILAIVTFSALAGLLYLAVPLAVDAVVSNIAFGGQDRPYFQALLTVSILLFAFLSLLAVIRTFQHYLAEVIQRRIFLRLTADLSYRLPRVRQDALDQIHAPELVNRFFDTLTVQKSSALILLEGVNLVLSTLIGLAVLAVYHPYLLAYSVGLISFVGLILYPGGLGAVQTSIRESVAKYAVAGWLEQLATYPTLFKSPGGSRYALYRANRFAMEYLQARRAHFRILIRQIAALFGLQALAGAGLLVLGGFLVLRAELTLGQLVASELIVSAVVAALAKFGKQLEAWYDALAAVDKLGYLVDLPIESTAGESEVPKKAGVHLFAKDVSFGYRTDSPLFQQINFDIEPGDRIGITGPDGCGASSLLDLMYGLRQANGGQLIADGLDLHHWDMHIWRDHVTLVRGHEIVDGSIADNLRLACPKATLQDLYQSLRQTDLLDEILQLPQGVDTQLLLGGRPLSASQRTRLALARAWLGQPQLLLLDMAIDGLDMELRDRLATPIFDQAQPWTVVVISRDPSILKRCHRVYRIEGRHMTVQPVEDNS
jgi:ABC-type bacteriocin/lantibiotic exporter with double-glycine peptidase domain